MTLRSLGEIPSLNQLFQHMLDSGYWTEVNFENVVQKSGRNINTTSGQLEAITDLKRDISALLKRDDVITDEEEDELLVIRTQAERLRRKLNREVVR